MREMKRFVFLISVSSHFLPLSLHNHDPKLLSDVFKLDPEFEKNEKQYDEIRAEIIGDADDSDEEGSGDEDEASGDEGGEHPGL